MDIQTGLQKVIYEPETSASQKVASIAKEMWKQEGFRLFYEGITPRVLRVPPGQGNRVRRVRESESNYREAERVTISGSLYGVVTSEESLVYVVLVPPSCNNPIMSQVPLFLSASENVSVEWAFRRSVLP